jgi:hypothetical protein
MSIDLSERAYAMDTADKLLVRHSRPINGNTANFQVVGTADRKIHVVDLNTPGSIYRVGHDSLSHALQKELTYRPSILR